MSHLLIVDIEGNVFPHLHGNVSRLRFETPPGCAVPDPVYEGWVTIDDREMQSYMRRAVPNRSLACIPCIVQTMDDAGAVHNFIANLILRSSKTFGNGCGITTYAVEQTSPAKAKEERAMVDIYTRPAK